MTFRLRPDFPAEVRAMTTDQVAALARVAAWASRTLASPLDVDRHTQILALAETEIARRGLTVDGLLVD